MKLLNPLKSLSWRSLFRRPRTRLRRRMSSFSPVGFFAAEVLEDRALLSGNVNLTVSAAGAMTLTSTDASDDNIAMFRNGGGKIQFDTDAATQITYLGNVYTGADALELTIPTVQSITVNLGSGYSTYNISDISTTGNIQFNGKAAGINGADLNIYSEDLDVVIGGSVINNVIETGSGTSDFNLYTDSSHNLTVNGSVTSNQLGAGSGERDNYVYTDGSGNLWIKGAVALSTSGSGDHYNEVTVDDTGNLTVGLGVAFVDSGNGYHEAEVETEAEEESGNIKIGLGVSFIDSGNGEHDHEVAVESDFTTSNITIGAGVTVVDSGNGDHYQEVVTDDSGTLAIGLGVTIKDAGNGYHEAEVEAEGDDSTLTVGTGVVFTDSGNGDHYHEVATEATDASLTIGLLGVSVVDSGTGTYHELDIHADDGDGSPVLIKGSVTFVDTGTAHDYFYIFNDEYADSPITINGSVTFTHSNVVGGHDDVEFYGSTTEENALVTIKGAVTLNLSKVASTADDSEGYDYNYVYLGSTETDAGEGYGLIVNGPTTIVGGNGEDFYQIEEARFNGIVTINTMSNPTTAGFNDYIEVDGSLFAGASNTFTMAGKGAVLSLNNADGFLEDGYSPAQTTEFKGTVRVVMNGPAASVHVADGSAPSSTLVKFDSAVAVVGGTGGIPAGTLFVSLSNSSFAVPAVRTNFALVTVA